MMFLIPNKVLSAEDAMYVYTGNGFACDVPHPYINKDGKEETICVKWHSVPNGNPPWSGYRKSVAGIFHAMRKDGVKWVNSTAPKPPSDDPYTVVREGTRWAGETGIPYLVLNSSDDGRSMIYRRGGVCFGHRTSDRPDDQVQGFKVWTYDVNLNSNETLQYLGYIVYQSTKANEIGGVNQVTWKPKIAKWMQDNGKGVLQEKEGAVSTYKTEGAINYVNSILNMKMKTNSTANSGQTVTYKDGKTFIGPYHLENYNGTIGKLTKAIVTDQAGNQTTTTLASIGGNTVQSLNTIENSPTGGYNNFYIVVDGNITSVKSIDLYKDCTYYKARAVEAEPNNHDGQNMAIFYGYETTEAIKLTLPGTPKEAKIKIKKVDGNTNIPLAGVTFVVKHETNGYINGAGWTTSISQATKFTTDSNGVLEIKGITATGKYTLYEIGNNNAGYIEVSISKPINVKEVTVSSIGTTVDAGIVTNTSVANLKLNKIDKDTGASLANVGFVLKYQPTGQYVINGANGKVVTFTTDIKKATTFLTGDTVKNISKTGKYLIYEVVNPHFGYEEVSYEKPKLVGEYTIDSLGGATYNKEITLTNQKEFIKLSGYVWEDIISQKMSVRNGLWNNDANDDKDKRVNNVKVTLRKADGTVLDTKITAGEGAYIFGDYENDPKTAKIRIDDLVGAYVEFEYNGMSYKSVTVNSSATNGSKATDDKLRENFNNKYSTIINNQAVGTNGQKTSLKYDYVDHKSTLNYEGTYKYGYEDKDILYQE